ncbi:hypothetical protein I308_102592 [Cryptococcus tetragattii IND107]|uniref:Uncharacterized protein n=1 Tax=Cryptococcus tetragattii IND107 TaxID=1296105 RepID=A0ABR3BTZ3_9TREE
MSCCALSTWLFKRFFFYKGLAHKASEDAILSHMRGRVMKAVTIHPKDKYPFYLASFNQLIAPCFPIKWLFNAAFITWVNGNKHYQKKI